MKRDVATNDQICRNRIEECAKVMGFFIALARNPDESVVEGDRLSLLRSRYCCTYVLRHFPPAYLVRRKGVRSNIVDRIKGSNLRVEELLKTTPGAQSLFKLSKKRQSLAIFCLHHLFGKSLGRVVRVLRQNNVTAWRSGPPTNVPAAQKRKQQVALYCHANIFHLLLPTVVQIVDQNVAVLSLSDDLHPVDSI